MHADTREVRQGEALDWAALARYLRWHLSDEQVPGLRLHEPMEVLQFAGGHSNLTYLIRFGGGELVIRRPPVGPVPPRAHDMAREHRWLTALHPFYPRAPRPILLCDDASVIGAVFYVMERRRGMIVRHDEPLPIAGHADVRRRVSEGVVDALVELHAVDVSRDPLQALGKPVGFLERQVRGWNERWVQSRVDPVPELDRVAAWLASRMPDAPSDATVVHGDLKLDNVVLDPLDPGRVTAVLDWEMAALGDPLVDVGILLSSWVPMQAEGPADALSSVTARAGYLSREELLERYAVASGRDVTGIRYYEAFALFKIAVVIQQIYARYRAGQTADSRFARFDARVRALARRAWETIDATQS